MCKGIPATAAQLKGLQNHKSHHSTGSRKREDRQQFYFSAEWRTLRYEALKRYGRKCLVCGAGPKHAVLHVDHIKPISKFPELKLDINNLQILCEACNLGKSNRDQIDWRSA